jgi:hypothetical protein
MEVEEGVAVGYKSSFASMKTAKEGVEDPMWSPNTPSTLPEPRATS